jgi:hypothetical protein
MASHSIITLSTSEAVRLTPVGIHSGLDLTIQNINSDGYVYVGASEDLSSTNYGYRISPNNALAFELPGADSIYAIGSTTGLQIAVMKTNLESGA